ncbi:uncharacterized protein LOC109715311 [Ananas comosus]|uniref:Uncharacterized protein LOC109715311 n=1 Tax=Ananas comosus TaxID=4615 RepID=A0A6P5FJL5_ANACO|nr:uncharacterized protein LOC109715311 [Ananas comosus]
METELVFPVTHPSRAPNGAVPSPALPDLAAALHRASLAATAIVSSPSASPSAAAISALRDAHGAIGSFLAILDPSPPLSSTSLGGGGGDEPMEEEEEVLRGVEEVEEGMRECVLQSKRQKRHASPSWPLGGAATATATAAAAAERAAEEEEEKEVSFVRPAYRFPRRSSIDLVFQFHA